MTRVDYVPAPAMVDLVLDVERTVSDLAGALLRGWGLPKLGFAPGEGPCPRDAMVSLGISPRVATAALSAACRQPWCDQGATAAELFAAVFVVKGIPFRDARSRWVSNLYQGSSMMEFAARMHKAGVDRALVLMPAHVVSWASDAGYAGAFDPDREIYRTPAGALVLDP